MIAPLKPLDARELVVAAKVARETLGRPGSSAPEGLKRWAWRFENKARAIAKKGSKP